jgi:hypothetical protein
VFQYVLAAVHLVAEQGWKLLPDYRFDAASGLWRHRDGPIEPPLGLGDLRYGADGELGYPRHALRAPESALAGHLDEARELLAARQAVAGWDAPAGVSADFEALRWFELPAECLAPTAAAGGSR